MSTRGDDQSVFDEPHMRPTGPASPDPSEQRAERALGRERVRHPALPPDQSVYDEPDILPGRAPEVIDHDWSCSHCGYNLRGLKTGTPCPECGHIELYRPPPAGAPGYASWLRSRTALTDPTVGWSVAVVLALGGGLFAVFGAIQDQALRQLSTFGATGLLLIVLWAPAVEETLKIALTTIAVEVRPYWFSHAGQLRLAALGSAFVFAAIENVLYLNVYVPNPPAQLVLFRWTVCVLLHVVCTAIALRGVVRIWQRTMRELRPPRVADAVPALTCAIIIHACYNAAVTVVDVVF